MTHFQGSGAPLTARAEAAASRPQPMSARLWDTSSENPSTQIPDADRAGLGDHTLQCRTSSGRWGAVSSGAGQVFGFASARLVTTCAVLALGLTALWLWL